MSSEPPKEDLPAKGPSPKTEAKKVVAQLESLAGIRLEFLTGLKTRIPLDQTLVSAAKFISSIPTKGGFPSEQLFGMAIQEFVRDQSVMEEGPTTESIEDRQDQLERTIDAMIGDLVAGKSETTSLDEKSKTIMKGYLKAKQSSPSDE